MNSNNIVEILLQLSDIGLGNTCYIFPNCRGIECKNCVLATYIRKSIDIYE